MINGFLGTLLFLLISSIIFALIKFIGKTLVVIIYFGTIVVIFYIGGINDEFGMTAISSIVLGVIIPIMIYPLYFMFFEEHKNVTVINPEYDDRLKNIREEILTIKKSLPVLKSQEIIITNEKENDSEKRVQCPSCGYLNKAGNKFCSKCGMSII